MVEGKRAASKSKHRKSQTWKKYNKDGSRGRFCPRCGPGVFLALHKDRVTCGRCKYSETKKKQ